MRTPAVKSRSGDPAVRRARTSGEVVEDAVERPGHVAEVERLDEETRVAQLPSAGAAHEPPQLPLDRSRPPRGLPLERPERLEVAFRLEHRLDARRAQCANQLVLEVGLADEEAEALHLAM